MAEPQKLMRVKPQAPEFGRLPDDPMERLVHFARLAPSSHNSQPWRFVVEKDAIDVFADMNRALHSADKSYRELYLSVGCALEAMLIAADYEGFGARVALFPIEHELTYVARVTIARAGPKRDHAAGDLLHSLPHRHTSHRPFDRMHPVAVKDLERLHTAAEDFGATLLVLGEGPQRDALAQIVSRAEATLLADPAYREELGRWIGEGALGTSWLVSKLGQFAVAHLSMQDRVAQADTQWLASAPHVGLLVTADDGRAAQVRAGQAYMRIALMCESHEIRTQPMSAPLEVAATRPETAAAFGASGRFAQQLFRLGYAEHETVRTGRRSLLDVLVRGR